MFIIKKEPYENGGYPPIQTWDGYPIPETHAIVPDDMDTAVFYEYNGFVVLTIEEDTVTEMVANVEAWEAWKASLPDEPGPSESEDVWDELDKAYREGVDSV